MTASRGGRGRRPQSGACIVRRLRASAREEVHVRLPCTAAAQSGDAALDVRHRGGRAFVGDRELRLVGIGFHTGRGECERGPDEAGGQRGSGARVDVGEIGDEQGIDGLLQSSSGAGNEC